MQRYHFHFKWRDDAVFDEEGIEFENFAAAYVHACGLVQQVRSRLPTSGVRLVDRNQQRHRNTDNDTPHYGSERPT